MFEVSTKLLSVTGSVLYDIFLFVVELKIKILLPPLEIIRQLVAFVETEPQVLKKSLSAGDVNWFAPDLWTQPPELDP